MTTSPENPLADEQLGGRLRLLHPAELDAAQTQLYDHVYEHLVGWSKKANFTVSLPDGRLLGPLNAFLYSPVMGQAYQQWVEAERANTCIPPKIRTLIILTVGAAWQSAFELYAHSIAGRTVGLDEPTIAAIAAGTAPEHLSAEEAAAYRFTHSLVHTRRVPPEVYQAAVAAFTEKGVVDMLNLIGIFLTVSAVLNTFEVPVPA